MSSEAVTADKLAKALRKILESNSVDVLWVRTLLASYDAQQSNPSPVLVPTRNCSMADTGDFDECCIVCGESTDGGHSPERCIENIEEGIRQVIKFELSEELQRTKDEIAKVIKGYDSAMVRLSEETRRRIALNREDRIPGPIKPALPDKVGIWDAINRYVVACGGDPSSGVYGNTSRQTAVTDIERSIDASKPALSEVEKAAVNVVNVHDVVVRLSHRTVRGIEASVECDKTIEALRDALKRIGAL